MRSIITPCCRGSKCDEAVQTKIRSKCKRSHKADACVQVYFLTFARFHQKLFEYYKNGADTNKFLALETFEPWGVENLLHLVHLAKVIISIIWIVKAALHV